MNKGNVKHIARLANIPITEEEEKKLAAGFEATLEVVEQLNKLDTNHIEPTHQVTGLKDVFREDVIDEKQILTQAEALSNSKRHHLGYFVVKQILDK